MIFRIVICLFCYIWFQREWIDDSCVLWYELGELAAALLGLFSDNVGDTVSHCDTLFFTLLILYQNLEYSTLFSQRVSMLN